MNSIENNPQFQKDNDAMQRVILAGMKLMYDPKTFPLFKEGLTQDAPISQILSVQTAGLIKLLEDKSNNTIPKNIIAPSAIMLLTEMARFVTESGIAKPSDSDIKTAMQKVLGIVTKLYSAPPKTAPPQGMIQSGMGA